MMKKKKKKKKKSFSQEVMIAPVEKWLDCNAALVPKKQTLCLMLKPVPRKRWHDLRLGAPFEIGLQEAWLKL